MIIVFAMLEHVKLFEVEFTTCLTLQTASIGVRTEQTTNISFSNFLEHLTYLIFALGNLSNFPL